METNDDDKITGSSSKPARRPQTPQDFRRLKALLKQNKPTTPVPSDTPQSVQAGLATTPHANQPSSARRESPGASHISDDIKRDSAVTASKPGGRRGSLSASEQGSLRYQPSLPAIVVHDESRPQSKRSRSPFLRRRTRNTTAEDDLILPRIESFHGISMDIPTGGLDDLRDPDNIHFSKTGSMLLGPEQMDKLIANEEAKMKADETDAQPKGLKAGRRKPSIQMLQAALHGGRVLSAEEITFSLRVRSMYDRGEEDTSDWTSNQVNAEPRRTTPDTTEAASADAPSPSIIPKNGSLKVAKTRQDDSNTHLRPDSAARRRLSQASTDVRDVAGGMEDWEDIEGKDIDRYGFINPHRAISRQSSHGSQSPSRPGIQRVSTSLQVLSNSPRGKRNIRRGPSSATARSTRSTPPKRSHDNRSLRTQSSLYSFRSTSSSIFEGRFRSRNRRLMDEASDMLTLPPGLETIAEQQDAGKTATTLKRKEWSREAKWRKMAKLVNRGQAGAGMRFDFDTRDPTLISRTWKGIPDRWRATAWHSFLTTSAKRRGGYVSDEDLIQRFNALQEMSSPDDVQIDVDVPRTISMHVMFRKRYRGGQRLLFRVLHAISIEYAEVGYVQGMASLAATLLCYYDEEHAFVMLVRLWDLRGLQVLYRSGFEGLMAALDDFEKQWLGDGDIARKLKELNISGTAYGTRWYLTLFNMSIPFPAQLRIWDVFMLLGDDPVRGVSNSVGQEARYGGADMDVLHAASAALIDATRDIVIDSDFENAMKVLTSWVPVKDEDLLMRVAKAEYKAKKKRTKA